MVRFRSVACLMALVIAGWNLRAQQITGSIRGTVQDPSSAFVQRAAVSARQTETGLTRTATTDPSGTYILLELPVGHYELQVEAKGFQKYIQQGITLNVNETATIPVRLSVGADNVFNTFPDQNKKDANISLGRFIYNRNVSQFSWNGGFYYVKLQMILF